MFHLHRDRDLLAVMFYFYTSVQVARARVAYGVKAPAISGQSRISSGFSGCR